MFTEGCVFEKEHSLFFEFIFWPTFVSKVWRQFYRWMRVVSKYRGLFWGLFCTAYNVSIFRIESHSKLIYLSNLNLISIKESFGALDFCIWTLSSWIWCFGSNFETYICWVERTVPWPRPISKCKCFEFAQARRKFYRATDVDLVNDGCVVAKNCFDYVVPGSSRSQSVSVFWICLGSSKILHGNRCWFSQ